MPDIIAKVGTEVVGVAKDGHVIYGAVKSGSHSDLSEVLFSPCDLDGCNGKSEDFSLSGKKGYAYRATKFHPYLVGCFGPSNMPTGAILGQYCTENVKYCGASNLLSNPTATLLATTIAFALVHVIF